MHNMSAIKNYLSEPNDEDFNAVLKERESSPKTILGLVESLGPSLTSIDKDVRLNATRLLAEVIDQIHDLSPDDLEPLTDFFCDRIKDHHSIVPYVLTAFSALARHHSLPNANAILMVRAVFQHAEVQTLIQQHRAVAFELVCHLLNNKMDALVMMKEEFSMGYIQIIDGEKDPRNLLTVFRLTSVVINNFPIGVCCEDLFEVTACYFPVDFTPPPGAAFQITRQQLADQLRGALTATPKFAPFCLPLLVEKISSDLQTAKQDSFEVLADCCKVYSVEDMRPFAHVLTQLLLREAMLSPSSRTEELALKAITALALCLASPMDGVVLYTDVDDFCNELLKDCKHHMFEPDHKLVVPSINVLQALVSSHSHVAHTVLEDVLPLMLEGLATASQHKKMCLYLDVMTRLLGSCHTNVSTFKQKALPSVVLHLSNQVESVTVCALRCLSTMSDSIADPASLCQQLLQMSTGSDVKSVRDAASACLAVFLKGDVEGRTPHILHPLCQALATVSSLELSVLDTLNVITQHCGSDSCTVVLEPLLEFNRRCLTEQTGLLEPSAACLRHAVNSLSIDLDEIYLKQCLDMCVNATVGEVNDVVRGHVEQVVIQLVNHTETSCHKEVALACTQTLQLHPLSSMAVKSLLCTVDVQFVDEAAVLSQFTAVGVDTDRPALIRSDACKICSSIINKSQRVDSLLASVFPEQCPPGRVDPSHLLLYVWISRALVLRSHSLARPFLLQLVDWLSVDELSQGAGEAFEVILKEYTDVFSAQQRPTIKMMYKQRVFLTVFPVLHGLLTSLQSDLLSNVHLAITHLIRYVPRQVIANDKQMLLTVLIRLLSSEDQQVLQRTLQVLADDSDDGLLGQHLDTLLPVLLRLTRYAASMQVRISSLQCLGSLSALEGSLIAPHMNSVIKGLLPALDDRKRLVRKEAVKTRNTWCMTRDGS